MKVWLIPEAPVLNPITNDDYDGAYTISWTSVLDGTTYQLEEDEDDGFSSAATVYSGPDISHGHHLPRWGNMVLPSTGLQLPRLRGLEQ